MNIIFVSNNMAKAKTLSILQVGMMILALILLPVLLTLLLIVPQEVAAQKGGKSLVPAPLRLSFNINNPQKHLDAYAVQLGEMQARMMRLDAQSERLDKLASEKGKKSASPAKAGLGKPLPKANSGGPLVLSAPMTELNLQDEIEKLSAQIEFQTDYLSSVEAKLLQQSVLKDMLPNSSPVNAAYNSSSYGWRIDPFSGSKAFHKGLDFSANTGTSIRTTAAGIVSFTGQVPDYGKIVRIDHGLGLETHYAHCSKFLVKEGERVKKGQVVAEVGSTGRSTGPHLHYEIRLNGNVLDPRKYMNASR